MVRNLTYIKTGCTFKYNIIKAVRQHETPVNM
jgi:hypothetical protein